MAFQVSLGLLLIIPVLSGQLEVSMVPKVMWLGWVSDHCLDCRLGDRCPSSSYPWSGSHHLGLMLQTEMETFVGTESSEAELSSAAGPVACYEPRPDMIHWSGMTPTPVRGLLVATCRDTSSHHHTTQSASSRRP